MNDWTIERLLDRAQIHDAMLRWSRAVDRCDWDTIREVFHPDGYDDHGIYKGNVDGLVAWLSERHKSISRSMHLLGNMLIEFKGPDVAFVETYCLAVQRYGSGGSAETRAAITGGKETAAAAEFDMTMTGRYADEFERRGGIWKIRRRTVIFDNSMMTPVPADAPALGADWAISSRGKDDPIWAMRRAMGIGSK